MISRDTLRRGPFRAVCSSRARGPRGQGEERELREKQEKRSAGPHFRNLSYEQDTRRLAEFVVLRS
jgi:hypothetical protein